MPVTKTAKKELRKNIKRRKLNDQYKINMKISMNVFLKKAKKWEKLWVKDIADVYSKIDKMVKKNLIHKKNAARKKSRIARAFNFMWNKENTKNTKKSKVETEK